MCNFTIYNVLQNTEWCNDDSNYFCCFQLFHLPKDHLQQKFYILQANNKYVKCIIHYNARKKSTEWNYSLKYCCYTDASIKYQITEEQTFSKFKKNAHKIFHLQIKSNKIFSTNYSS